MRRKFEMLSRYDSALILGLLAMAGPVSAASYDVKIETSDIAGTDVSIAFDLLAGGASSSSISIVDFATDGTLSLNPTILGGVVGALPGEIALSTVDLFNEYLETIKLGTSISFTFNISGTPPASGATPDGFSFFLLNPIDGLPIFSTSDVTGSDALFLIAIDGTVSGALEVFSNTDVNSSVTWTVTPTPVPIPPAIFVFGTAFASLAFARRRLNFLR